MSRLTGLRVLIGDAQQAFAESLQRMLKQGGTTLEIYRRYLSMEYHLTKGVQRYFITAAAHEGFVKHKKLRQFLLDFGNEEESHYLVAANDLHKCGLTVTAEPFDVTLWHAYFRSVISNRPLLRLGAASILESISGGVARESARRALSAPFLTRENSKFLVMHMHESAPHGDLFLDALESEAFNEAQVGDLELGARHGTTLYMRMTQWCLFPDEYPECGECHVDVIERREIESLDMAKFAPTVFG